MKKTFLLMTLLMLTSLILAVPVATHQIQLDMGAGLFNTHFPIYVGLDYGLNENSTVGGGLSTAFYDHGNKFDIYGNWNYHFVNLLSMPHNTALYAGLSLCFDTWLGHEGHEDDHKSMLILTGQIGGRYYFNNNLGIHLEIGGCPTSNATFGISYKF
jgi:hypothetical protein